MEFLGNLLLVLLMISGVCFLISLIYAILSSMIDNIELRYLKKEASKVLEQIILEEQQNKEKSK